MAQARRGNAVRAAFWAAGLIAVLSLTACTPAATPAPSSAAPAAGPGGPPAPTGPPAPPPVLLAEGTAAENLPYFDHINQQVLAADPAAGGRAFVDALIAAGFSKEHLEVTRDQTTVGLDADSIQFSVRHQGECLIGQFVPASAGYHSMVAPLLGTGECLVGESRPIDW